MKAYLNSIIPQIKSFSESLDKTTLFVDKAWAYIDEDNAVQKLIFKRNNELVLSKNGKAEVGRWEYFPAAKSILIDRVTDKILCNEQYVDNGVMILKVDGTDNQFFALANERVVPDLDVYRYLLEVRKEQKKHLRIVEKRLIDGRVIDIKLRSEYNDDVLVGDSVMLDSTPIEDGKYQMEEKNKFLVIKKGRIFSKLIEKTFINPIGVSICVHMIASDRIYRGDYVYINGQQIENDVINFSRKYNLIVKNGVVEKFQFKSKFFRWLDWTIEIS